MDVTPMSMVLESIMVVATFVAESSEFMCLEIQL